MSISAPWCETLNFDMCTLKKVIEFIYFIEESPSPQLAEEEIVQDPSRLSRSRPGSFQLHEITRSQSVDKR